MASSRRDGKKIGRTATFRFVIFLFAFIFGLLLPISIWTAISAQLITLLSILLGAFLIRMARPFPITDATTFNHEDEISALQFAVEGTHKRIFLISKISIGTIILILTISAIPASPIPYIHRPEELIGAFERAEYGQLLYRFGLSLLSGTITLLSSLLLFALFAVLYTDTAISARQSKALKTAYSKAKAEKSIPPAYHNLKTETDGGRYPGRGLDKPH